LPGALLFVLVENKLKRTRENCRILGAARQARRDTPACFKNKFKENAFELVHVVSFTPLLSQNGFSREPVFRNVFLNCETFLVLQKSTDSVNTTTTTLILREHNSSSPKHRLQKRPPADTLWRFFRNFGKNF
jgi:hypothetical protein